MDWNHFIEIRRAFQREKGRAGLKSRKAPSLKCYEFGSYEYELEDDLD